jgi:hypothetical protein
MYFRLAHQQARDRAVEAVRNAPDGFIVRISEETRTLAQNALLWPLLDCCAKQVDWYGQKLTKEEWKDVFTASLKKQKVVPGLDGGFVVCGQSTKVMPKKEFSDLCELIFAFGAQRGVNFGNSANHNEAYT